MEIVKGARVRVRIRTSGADGLTGMSQTRNGTVLEVYPRFVLVLVESKRGKPVYRETFRRSEILEPREETIEEFLRRVGIVD